MEKTIKLSRLNQLFSNIPYSLTSDKRCKLVSQSSDDNYGEEVSQGNSGTQTSIYEIEDELFIKVVETSDSYGTETGINSIQFVQPVPKQITDYVPVK